MTTTMFEDWEGDEPIRSWYLRSRGDKVTIHASLDCSGDMGIPMIKTARQISGAGFFCRRCTLSVPEITILGELGEL